MSDWLSPKLPLLERFFWTALLGGILASAGILLDSTVGQLCAVIGMLMIVPLLVYLSLLPIWHWKERYCGEHSHLWGAALVLETSGWSKIIYWFRHILPDHRRRGRYARTAEREDDVAPNAARGGADAGSGSATLG